jgi:mRNA interferase RelE/StbE
MGYRIVYHYLVEEDIRQIPANIRKRIQDAIENRLIIEPVLFGKPLRQSLKGFRKMRVGDYGIIYQVEKETITVLKIGHRKDVYEKVWKRMN